MRTLSKRVFGFIALFLLVMCMATPITVGATTLDDLAGSSNNGSTQNSTTDSSIYAKEPNSNSNYSDETTQTLTDYLKDYNAVTNDQMQAAQTYASPIVNFLGILSGFILTITSAAIFVVTAFDLLYIGVPLLRPYIDGGKTAAMSGGAGSPMGGMGMGGMGMGMHGGMRGGMGMGMGGGMGQQAPASPLSRFCLVSDEAVQCVMLANQPAGGAAPMGGMGMGGMGMGGMGMQAQQPQVPTKSIIFTYLKKRIVFLVIFFVAMIVLMSSVFTDCGINLAQLFMNIMNNVNNTISNVQV